MNLLSPIYEVSTSYAIPQSSSRLKKALKCFNNSYMSNKELFFPQAAEARPPLAQTLLSSLAVSTA